MIILDATSKSLTAVLSGAITTTQPDYVVAYVDLPVALTAFTPGSQDGQFNSATPVTIASAPAASTSRQIKGIVIPNRDTVAVTVTVNYVNGVNTRRIYRATLPANYTLTYTDGDGWRVWDTTGALLVTAPELLEAGTYTPTLTNVTNLAASTAYSCQYLRVGSVVTVSGRVDVDPTAAVATELGISLPFASNFANANECAGAAAAPGIAGQSAAVLGDATNNRAALQWVAVDVTNQAMYFSFSYRVI